MRQRGQFSVAIAVCVIPLLISCSSGRHTGSTVGSLSDRVTLIGDDVVVEDSRRKAIASYREFLQESEQTEYEPEAMRRLGDLQIEQGDERLTSEEPQVERQSESPLTSAEYQESIELYHNILSNYPDYPLTDRVLYQLAKAYEHTGQNEKAMSTLDQLVMRYPDSQHFPEAQFRRGEILFVEKEFRAAQQAYQAVIDGGESTLFYEHALYKQGWSLFKQTDYEAALDAFMVLLDRKLIEGAAQTEPASLSRPERELLDDTLRVASLSFSYRAGASSIADYFSTRRRKPYEALLYERLGDMYLDNERFSDAAGTYVAFVERNPYHHQAPTFQMKVIEAYQRGGFPSSVLAAKKDYVTRYQLKSAYWQHHDPAKSAQTVTFLKANLNDLARHYHALAQHSKKRSDYAEAATWYRTYLDSFSEDPQAAGMNFLLAEILFETKQYRDAAFEYERTAYQYARHEKAAEAGYAALIAFSEYQKQLTEAQLAEVKRHAIASALRFGEDFPQHPKAASVLTKASEDLFALRDYKAASAAANRVIANHPNAAPELRRTAWIVIAHSAFDTNDYLQAEAAYQQALKIVPKQDKQRPKLEKRLAAAIYKQGEASREAGDLPAAVSHFLRVGQVLPAAPIRATAEYDAAAALITMQDWPRAARVLEGFRKRYPKHQLQPEVTQKLAVAYQQSGQGLKAAAEFERIGQGHGDQQLRREATLQAAELYTKSGTLLRATTTLERYVKQFPRPTEPAIEARQQLAEIYKQQGDIRKRNHWLEEIVKADKTAGAERSERTRYLAANAALVLAKPAGDAYRRAKLVVPLKKSLKEKKRRMEKALEAYGKAADYDVEAVTTASTFHIANIYHDFSRALMESERPKGLSAEELEQYEILLEEQAFPFEEKAIEVYEVNLQRTASGVYDDWVKKSITKLAELVPVRYAKTERSETVVEAIQ